MRRGAKSGGIGVITIDPAVDNAPAVACYEKAGFRRVGVTRASWRDPAGRWRDALPASRELSQRDVWPDRETEA